MITLKGKYNTADVLVSNVADIESSCIDQIKNILNSEYSKDSNIAIMPDTHAGKGCVIGFTQTIKDKVIPDLVGVDIGCGMLVVKIPQWLAKDIFSKESVFENIDKIVYENIPMGIKNRYKRHPFSELINLENLVAFSDTQLNKEIFLYAIGSLGGSNHFMEWDKDSIGNYYLVIHTGSRNLGKKVCDYHQKLVNTTKKDEELKLLISNLKKQGRDKEIGDQIKNFKMENRSYISYLEGKQMEDYLNDMKIVQKFADLNRKAIADTLLSNMGLKFSDFDSFSTVHNYIDMEDMILRKGAISLKKDERAIIPMNMAFGSLIVVGKGNPLYNYSGPHGAGRKMSRSSAKENISLQQFRDSMKNVYSSSIALSTIDESPMAYKNPEQIIENLGEVCSIDKVIKPVYNIKAK